MVAKTLVVAVLALAVLGVSTAAEDARRIRQIRVRGGRALANGPRHRPAPAPRRQLQARSSTPEQIITPAAKVTQSVSPAPFSTTAAPRVATPHATTQPTVQQASPSNVEPQHLAQLTQFAHLVTASHQAVPRAAPQIFIPQQNYVTRTPFPTLPPISPTPPLRQDPRPAPRALFQNFAIPQRPPQTHPAHRPAANTAPIVALSFDLKHDGSYITNSETGDGTVREERGQFNGVGMAVQGMYAYQADNGPVQVNYVADEYGFQPQGPNIHPAILQAVAEQVQFARSAKAQKAAQGLNGILDEDYDDGSAKRPPPRRVAVSQSAKRL